MRDQNTYRSLVRIVGILAGTVSLIILLAIPASYFAISYDYEARDLHNHAHLGAESVSEIIYTNPDLWKFEEHRLVGVLMQSALRNESRHIRVVDTAGAHIASVLGHPETPTFSRHAELTDGMDVVGKVEVVASLRPLLLRTLLATLISAFLAAGVYVILKILPLRALTKVIGHLDESQKTLREEIQAKETALQRAQEIGNAMRHQALHDALTNLPNRILLHDRLQQAILTGLRENKTLALIMMDIDQFKAINDSLGHQAGDMVLQQIALRLPQLLRESDSVARLGGDEFAFLLAPVTDRSSAIIVAERILQAVRQPITINDWALHVSASLGIAIFPEHGAEPEKLMRCADIAMYSAKKARNNFVIYSPDLDAQNEQHRFLQHDLETAIEGDQLVLYYQPKIDLKSNRICGVEALVRWQHPTAGLIFPDDFIPMAERSGLIKQLTSRVLKMALQQAIEWQRRGLVLPIAVNISAINLQDSLFPQHVAEMMRLFSVPAALIEMEVTETALMQDPLLAIETVKKLNDIGISISIDDYGTGYSSMAYLKKLVVEKIKIDKSFVMDMIQDESDAIIVHSTIELAHNLGLSVIAEGVENVEIFQRLKYLGCDVAQGYYISRPVSVSALNEWLGNSTWAR